MAGRSPARQPPRFRDAAARFAATIDLERGMAGPLWAFLRKRFDYVLKACGMLGMYYVVCGLSLTTAAAPSVVGDGAYVVARWPGGTLTWDPMPDLMSHLGMKKYMVFVVLYWQMIGVTGFRQASLQRLQPGTLVSPLLPRLVGCRRTWLHCTSFAVYVATLAHTLLTPIEPRDVLPALVTGLVAVACDLSLVGFHVTNHVWMLVCLGIGNGVAKIGPWWDWVIPGIFKHSLFAGWMSHSFWSRWCMVDPPRDSSPSKPVRFLAFLGWVQELVFPALCLLAPPDSLLRLGGVAGMHVYHVFIITTDNGVLWNWQITCMYLCEALFGWGSSASSSFWQATNTSPALVTFVAIVAVLVPVVGLVVDPTLGPDFMTHREGSWQYRDGLLLVKKGAFSKLRALKSHTPCVYWRFVPEDLGGPPGLPRQSTCEVLARLSGHWNAGNPVCQPCYRGLVSIIDTWMRHAVHGGSRWPTADEADGWVVIPALVFFNALLPAYYRMGSLWFRACVRRELVTMCGFELGEFAMFQLEPMTVGQRAVVQYRLFDAVSGPDDEKRSVSAKVPFDALLEAHQATSLKLRPEWISLGHSRR